MNAFTQSARFAVRQFRTAKQHARESYNQTSVASAARGSAFAVAVPGAFSFVSGVGDEKSYKNNDGKQEVKYPPGHPQFAPEEGNYWERVNNFFHHGEDLFHHGSELFFPIHNEAAALKRVISGPKESRKSASQGGADDQGEFDEAYSLKKMKRKMTVMEAENQAHMAQAGRNYDAIGNLTRIHTRQNSQKARGRNSVVDYSKLAAVEKQVSQNKTDDDAQFAQDYAQKEKTFDIAQVEQIHGEQASVEKEKKPVQKKMSKSQFVPIRFDGMKDAGLVFQKTASGRSLGSGRWSREKDEFSATGPRGVLKRVPSRRAVDVSEVRATPNNH